MNKYANFSISAIGRRCVTDRKVYDNPLVHRYATKEMSYIWSPEYKFTTWRQLWIELARAQKSLGLNITDAQIAEMEANKNRLDIDRAEVLEKKFRHDVMSHVHAFGEQCPSAKAIIHLGATSCYVGDNTDLIQIRKSLELVHTQLIGVIQQLSVLAERYKDMPTLAFTHFQPAQLTTVGKRMILWLQEFLMDAERIEREMRQIPFLGVKGTTGTQASFLELFDGDVDKVDSLEQRVTKAMGFERVLPVSGQTYTRKIDFYVLSALSGVAQSAHKMATDIRLWMHRRECEEPFDNSSQIGSSAMAYKRNPMRCERICSLSRYVMNMVDNTAQTAANQWFERTLDDSANRRLSIPEAFLAVDGILRIVLNVTHGLQIWPLVIERSVATELPYIATENIIMAGVKLGGDRQELHEAIRVHSMNCARRMKEQGLENDLLQRIQSDPLFKNLRPSLDSILDPKKYVGCAPTQVENFLNTHVRPFLSKHDDTIRRVVHSDLSV